MKLLVIGREGQVARSLFERSTRHDQIEIMFAGRPQLDFERPETIATVIRRIRPDVIVNAAAWTAVDLAVDEPARAHTVNAIAPGLVAESAQDIGARLIHISTDYVFDGQKDAPYSERDPTHPQSIYGKTKCEGEQRVRAATDEHVILRTAWVFSPYGKNFVKTMLSLATSRVKLQVVDDQLGNPTSALDLADAIFAIVEKWQGGSKDGLGQIFHCANQGETNWADFARHIFETSKSLGGPFAQIEGIPTSQWPTKAARPKNSRLDCGLLNEVFGLRMRQWNVALAETVSEILQKKSEI